MLKLEGPTRDTDRALIALAKAGDRAAFDALVRAHLPGIYALLFRLSGNHEDAEDLAQECFVRAWRALDHYRGGAPFAPWLRRIALHLARDHFRSRARRGSPADAAGEPIELRGAHEVVAGRELRLGLLAALDRLPPRLRATLVLRVLEGLDYDEIARAVGGTPATARTRAMQARRLLLRWMKPWLEGPPREEERSC